MLRDADYLEDALYLAQKHGEHEWCVPTRETCLVLRWAFKANMAALRSVDLLPPFGCVIIEWYCFEVSGLVPPKYLLLPAVSSSLRMRVILCVCVLSVCVPLSLPAVACRYLKIQIENRGRHLDALQYIQELPFLLAEKSLKEYGHALVSHCPEEVRVPTSPFCFSPSRPPPSRLLLLPSPLLSPTPPPPPHIYFPPFLPVSLSPSLFLSCSSPPCPHPSISPPAFLSPSRFHPHLHVLVPLVSSSPLLTCFSSPVLSPLPPPPPAVSSRR